MPGKLPTLIGRILSDYYCRLSPGGTCAAPKVSDDDMARLLSSRYRPSGTSLGGGLQPGSTPEGTLTTDSAAAAIPTTGFPAPPYITQEVDQDEFRTTIQGGVNGPGLVTIFPAVLDRDVDILEITMQPAAQTPLQLYLDNATIMTARFTVQALQPWSAPGFTINRTQSVTLYIGIATNVVFEVRWKIKIIAPLPPPVVSP